MTSNLHVDEAAFVVVLGASGSGKTTLLNLIGALDAPTAGTIRLNGQDLTTASRARRMMIRRHTVSFRCATCCVPRGARP
jgi:putative ABC transport system ATP-binding protein